VPFHQHLGLYAYRREFLLRVAATPPSSLEMAEKLEQLRVLQMGEAILVAVVPHAHLGIDTPADYAAFVARHRRAG
jgi:3-deoxy-manno-octulosonate cytidylyltransferase (CMP-KDO synthetase)